MLYILLQIILITLGVLLIYRQLLLTISRSAPSISSSYNTAKFGFEALNITKGNIVYDLGCGNCKMLVYFWKHCPDATYVGIDHSPIALLMAHIRIFMAGAGKNITVRKADILKTDLTGVDRIFIWLSADFLKLLADKFKKELKPGSKVVSCDFRFEGITPTKIIDTGYKGMFGKTLYLYEF